VAVARCAFASHEPVVWFYEKAVTCFYIALFHDGAMPVSCMFCIVLFYVFLIFKHTAQSFVASALRYRI
jgi:hypothetical protein